MAKLILAMLSPVETATPWSYLRKTILDQIISKLNWVKKVGLDLKLSIELQIIKIKDQFIISEKYLRTNLEFRILLYFMQKYLKIN